MNVKVKERILEIRATIQQERKAIADLARKADALRPELRDVTSMLDLVEGGCLESKILAEPRTDGQWKYLLDSATALLSPAVERRKYIAEQFAKTGPNLKRIS